MDERRAAYLRRIGVDVWVPRALSEGAADLTQPPPPLDDGIAPPRETTFNEPSQMGWDELARTVAACQKCELARGRTQAVLGVGNREADWMIIGEAPGAEEDRQGEPFVGRAGQLLNAMLSAIGLERRAVYIANIVKCRPPGNRDPEPQESECCLPYLRRQIELVAPHLILVVGRIAAQGLLRTNASLAHMRGRRFAYGEREIPVIVTYHPAYLLRTPREKRKAWSDLLLARSLVEQRAGQR